MTGYQKIKEQLDFMKKSRDYESHRATVYFLAIMSHIEKNSEQMQKIKETARYLFKNYPGEDHEYDPILKFYEEA